MKIHIPKEIMDAIQQTHERHEQLHRERLSELSPDVSPRLSLRLPAMTSLETAEDVTAPIMDAVREMCDDWYADASEQIEWDLFWDRLESSYNISIANPDSPAARKIQRTARQHRMDS